MKEFSIKPNRKIDLLFKEPNYFKADDDKEPNKKSKQKNRGAYKRHTACTCTKLRGDAMRKKLSKKYYPTKGTNKPNNEKALLLFKEDSDKEYTMDLGTKRVKVNQGIANDEVVITEAFSIRKISVYCKDNEILVNISDQVPLNKIRPKPLFFVVGKIFDNKVSFFIDVGFTSCMVSYNLIKKINISFEKKTTYVTAVGGDHVKVLGKALVPITFENVNIIVQFQVLEDCAVPLD
ncbi:hypothetical protein BB559_000374 [Furculomyces boomerangus]|uniref:Aspartic peptidase DDI1-type domain-containing protein n=1 Tax=Furculomyces boomerangus TaxID=61424 RepID=A0A2T9Z5K4_9FUNG|nr:hypothetical protein BB559_000374 [Furculomyces boomerangus]